jgi:hypothetical protein
MADAAVSDLTTMSALLREAYADWLRVRDQS